MNNNSNKNIVLVMSGGVGKRFGNDIPKQYNLMMGRPVIEYAIDAARLASSTDDVVIVTTAEYEKEVYMRYGFQTTIGGKDRTESLANGLKYVADNYTCKKIIIANAVCPLMTPDQINYYFKLLDDYDYVLTTWKIVSTLGRYDGLLVDRNEYFQCMEPEAYRFKLLFENYKKDYPVPYIFHQLPTESKGFYCFDYPYTMKITYARDIKIAELLYKDTILDPMQDKTRRAIDSWLSSYGNHEAVGMWISEIPHIVEELANRWGITNYRMNPLTFATCVFEATSNKYGEVILKLHSPTGRYSAELTYYIHSKDNPSMARLIDYDNDYRAMLIEKVKPGIQVKFDAQNKGLRSLFDNFTEHLIPANLIENKDSFPTIEGEFLQSKELSNTYNVLNEFRLLMQDTALRLWKDMFASSQMFFLHRDLHRRNLLANYKEVKAIDPLGVIGPKEFEYTISLIIEAKSEWPDPLKIYNEMMAFFEKYCDRRRLRAAAFITWVHKMDEYVFVKHDNFKLANWCANMINRIFFDGDNNECDYYNRVIDG